MGMRRAAYWTSWLITYGIVLLVTCGVMTLFIHIFGLVKHSSLLLVYILLYSYGLSLLSIGMVVATFFSDAKVLRLNRCEYE